MESVPSQKGKVAIVTGANAGLGYETALALAKKDAKVIMACRNDRKAQQARDKIKALVPKAELEIRLLDLSNLQKVREFAKGFLMDYDQLDLLINNAGVMIPPYSETEEGFESQMGVNYFGHFLLTGLLLPVLNKTPDARIVSLSSLAHERGEIDFENLNAEKGYSKMGAYSQSKLACLMFSLELDRRLKAAGSQVISVAAHPGVSNTDLSRHINKVVLFLLYPLFLLMIHAPRKAALPTLMAALDSKVEGGDYFGPNSRRGMKGAPAKVEAKPHAYNEEVAKKLWEVSEDLVGIQFDL